MTDAALQRNAHVLVLQEMRARFTEAGIPSRTAALDAAIFALTEQRPAGQEWQLQLCDQSPGLPSSAGDARMPYDAMGPVDAPNPPAEKSREPSPAGQSGALAEAARRVISDIDSGDYHGEISEATYAALQSALAARQPVGISAEWVLGCLTPDAPEDCRQAIRDAFDEYAALPGDLQPVSEMEAYQQGFRDGQNRTCTVLARQPVGQEPVAWMTHHDEPMLYPTFGEAAALCDDDEPPIPLYAAPSAQAVDLGAALIPDTPEVRDILGRPNFWCSPWANVLRMRGDAIPHKAEEEQAAMLRFMLNHYLANGTAWAETAEAELDAIRKADSKADGKAVGNG